VSVLALPITIREFNPQRYVSSMSTGNGISSDYVLALRKDLRN
jgi:hypothetical protein